MPLYTYGCSVHGLFEVIQSMDDRVAQCPRCGREGRREITSPARIVVNEKERLPYGTGSRGRFISHAETGGMDIFVPSFGAMEKEEVDYVTEGAIEKEKARVRKQRTERRTQKQIGALMGVAYAAKPGQRAKAVRQVINRGR